MKRYKESKQQSAELLRLVLACVGQHDAACNPIAFAVWYEHVAGTNPRLNVELAKCLQDEPRLGDAAILRLHRDCIAGIDEATAERVRSDFSRVMGDLSQSAAQTGDSASEFGQCLSQLNRSLESAEAADAPVLAAQMAQTLASTAQMKSAVDALHQQVQTSQREIDALRRELERTRDEAVQCPLTKILNRKGFDQRLQAMLEGQSPARAGGSLIMIDIDHFKQINDRHGHLIGDRILAALGEALRLGIGAAAAASAARYGGEEFAILLPGAEIAQAQAVAEALRLKAKMLKVRQRGSDAVLSAISVSAGVAALQPGDDASALIARADAALYRSKQTGRDRVTLA
ncbi:MAG: GGDEF domain-containing protein [Burkholderiaceae bacterium]|nr:GGDEF domain-containing protein [Burkholderiaceae bacterium]